MPVKSARILILDDDDLIRTVLAERLERAGHEVLTASTIQEARDHIARTSPDLALLDIKLPDGVGTEILRALVAEGETACIMMTAHATVELAVEALKEGALDFVAKPFKTERLDATVAAALERTALRREVRAMRARSTSSQGIVGESPAMREVMDLVERVAPAESSTVLLEGETGTGKGVIARAIHDLSPRVHGPFVNVTCSALAETVMESELFGHEKGAFTDARTLKRGLVEIADGGTLFMDEVGELSLRLQGKLLRFIEEKAFRRIGGTRDLTVDARIVAATNRDLEAMVESGEFRADLFYRLRVIPIHLPPLRERPSDIAPLARAFALEFSREFGRGITGISPEALEVLRAHPWPGNVREVRNMMERCVLLAPGPRVEVEDLPAQLRRGQSAGTIPSHLQLPPDGLSLESLEEDLLTQALARAEGNRSEAGRLLGLSRHQVRNRLIKLGLDE
jgi:DNA-binding NtrC family response regulator